MQKVALEFQDPGSPLELQLISIVIFMSSKPGKSEPSSISKGRMGTGNGLLLALGPGRLGDGLSLPLPEYSLPLVSTRSSGPSNPKGRLASKVGFVCCHPLKVDSSPCLSLRIHQ
jgi:hypothetical protein